ncbi:hypothetical protein BEN78_09765 [Xanthomonas citri pv. mangiferaeindicae]|nr:hypothetical protein BEN78_09765 [Xanthomonas citri pv. mangiferaeindicae]
MTPHDPYTAPRAPLESPDAVLPPMFGYVGLLLATIFGSLLGGGLILALNFRAMRRHGEMLAAICLPIVAVWAMRFMAPLVSGMPDGALRLGVALTWCLTMLATMRAMQGGELARRRAAGQRRRPWWLAFGLGLVVSVMLILMDGLVRAFWPRTFVLAG